MSVSLIIDKEQYGAVLRAFSTFPGEIDKAEIRALNKTALWVKTQAARDSSHAAKVASKVIRRRIRILRASKRIQRAKVWFGLNPILARDLGKIRETKKGIRAGRHHFPGAFVTGLRSGYTSVFERVQPGKRWTINRPRSASANLPIRQSKLTLENTEVQRVIERTYQRAGARFVVILRQELNYIVNVAKSKGRK